MNIGARLEAIAALVPQNCVVADIGTDHAYLPVWLMHKGLIKAAIAADIAEGPCRAAQTNIGMYGLKDKIEVRRGSGLTVLKPGEADGAVIAGMGGSTIVQILEESTDVAKALKGTGVPLIADGGLRYSERRGCAGGRAKTAGALRTKRWRKNHSIYTKLLCWCPAASRRTAA